MRIYKVYGKQTRTKQSNRMSSNLFPNVMCSFGRKRNEKSSAFKLKRRTKNKNTISTCDKNISYFLYRSVNVTFE